MRTARIKLNHAPVFYHLYNRVAGPPDFLPFGPAEKEFFARLLHKLDRFFTVKVVDYQVMSNHFHLVVYTSDQPPSPEETCQRYNTYYRGKHILKPDDPLCEVVAERMRDISWYMQALQQQFTLWFNRNRCLGRRGTLWADRFKHTILGDAEAVWECIKYIHMNPVRAGMVEDPADYRFGSYGVHSGYGRHPFEQNVKEVLLPWLQGAYGFTSVRQLHAVLNEAFKGVCAVQQEPDGKVAQFALHVDRRVRYWVDGLVIGSELFINDVVTRSGPHLNTRRRGVNRARDPGSTLCCYKQLRAI